MSNRKEREKIGKTWVTTKVKSRYEIRPESFGEIKDIFNKRLFDTSDIKQAAKDLGLNVREAKQFRVF